ncbi:MAG: 50S ribosomal protein L25 [Planctomycetota bacterium]
MTVNETQIQCEPRTSVGSRSARRLRYDGRMVGCIQASEVGPHLDLHFDAKEFETARRKHVHLFDLVVGGTVHSAVVNALQWDALGDTLLHVEFRSVVRGVETESKVELQFIGVAAGVVQHTLNEVSIRCIPSLIPDAIMVRVEGLTEGTHIRAKDLVLPTGVTLATDPEAEVAVISGIKVAAEPVAEDETPA